MPTSYNQCSQLSRTDHQNCQTIRKVYFFIVSKLRRNIICLATLVVRKTKIAYQTFFVEIQKSCLPGRYLNYNKTKQTNKTLSNN